MQLVLVGLHQRTAPVALRERLAFGPDELCGALRTLRQYVDEGFIVSTCNRVEVCGLVPAHVPAVQALQHFLAEWHFVPVDQVTPHLYTYQGTAVVRHIFRLGAGLDSMVLGEDQILGQLKGTLSAAHAAGSIGAVLHRLLHTALSTGKAVRTSTGIAQNQLSVVSIAIDLARQSLDASAADTRQRLNGQRCLIVGAGQTAELALKYLQHWGARSIVVVNRTPARAALLASHYNGARARPWEQLEIALHESDLALACTSAPGAVLDAPMVARALEGRKHRSLTLLDLAVPRDIDPAVAAIDGVRLFDIDGLQEIAARNRAARAAEAASAEAVVAAEVEKFEAWLDQQRVVPTIRALREHAESIRNAELQRTLARCPELSPQEQKAIEALTSAIVNKLLHHPIAALKDGITDPHVAEAVHQLFQLSTAGR